MKSVLSAVTLIVLAGCASMESRMPTEDEIMSAIKSRFNGRPIGEAAMVYGKPDGQTEIGGNKVYIWHRSNTLTRHRTETITTQGTVGDPTKYPWAASVPYVSSTTYNRPESVGVECILSIGMDANGNMDGASINGKMGACQLFVP